jgi:caspase domain-containing protein
MSSTPEESRKWALLIGINQYPMFAPRGQLSGCVSDVQVMRQVLTESFSFPTEHVTVVTDDQATREGILAAMNGLLERVGNDDVVVFHYSGHGSQMTDVEGDEPDGLDETIVPYDSGREPHENRDIKDDEIYLWIQKLTMKTSNLTLIFDCCHSGNIVRDSFGGEARWVEPDLRPPDELPPSPIPAEARALLEGGRDLGPSGWLPLGERYTLLAGCRSNERSFEIEEPAGIRHGALTYFLAQELRSLQSGATYRDVFEAAAPRVSSRFNDQHPQLEGARDREVFGVRWIKPMPFVPVLNRTGDLVVLGGGAVCDLREGSQWALYPAGTKAVQPGEEPLGTLSVTKVRAVTSEGRLLSESRPGAVVVGSRAVEEIHPIESRMSVEVVPLVERGRDVQALLEGLGRSRLVRPAASGETGQARVYLLAPRSKVCAETPVPMLGALSEETWAVVGENGDLAMPPHRRSESGVTSLVLDNLERMARFRLTLRLRNVRTALTGKVNAELLRWVGGTLEQPEVGKGGDTVFHEGDRLVLRISHEYERPLFIYVLDLGLTGRIELVYPVSGAEGDPLNPKQHLDIGAREGEDLVLYMPEEFPFDRCAPCGESPEGVETLKVIATTHPTDFSPLLQTGMREGKAGAGPVSSLNDLLTATFGGGGYRDFRKRPAGDEAEDWTTVDQPFRLSRSAVSLMALSGGSSHTGTTLR